MRLIALLLLALAAVTGADAADDAAAAKFKVTVRNPGTEVSHGWTLRAGSRTLRPSGVVKAHASRKLFVKAPASTRRWRAGGRRCAVHRRRVACKLPTERYLFAPYVDMSLGAPPNLNASGARATSLGFVTARGGSECDPTWGGYGEYPASGKNAYARTEVEAYHGQAIPSFGGQAGTDLARVCNTVDDLVAAYRGVIEAYGATRIDFDIEGRELTADDGERRARAISHLQFENPALEVSFTLPSTPTGLDEDALNVVRTAIKNHVLVTAVNAMAMDYGDAVGPGVMGRRARDVARALPQQLEAVKSGQFARIDAGVTVMIGRNDDPGETLSRADAEALAAYAASHGTPMLSMWSLGRDRACTKHGDVTELDEACSGIAQPRWAFTRALGAFAR